MTSEPKTEVAVTSTSGEETAQQNAAYGMEGQALPAFTTKDREGKAVESTSFVDKPIFVMGFASWCPYCQRQMPDIQKLYEAYGDKVNFVLLDMVGWNNETQEVAQKYFDKNNYTMPFYLDEGQKIADLLQMESIPSMYVVGKDQQIHKVFAKVTAYDDLAAAFDEVLQ